MLLGKNTVAEWVCSHLFNLDYQFVEKVPIHNIDRETSWLNVARMGRRRNDEWISELATDLRAGAELPSPVLIYLTNDCQVGDRMVKAGTYLVAGGNHTIASEWEILGEKTTSAYVVKTDDKTVLDSLPIMLNAKGKVIDPPSRDEVIATAADQVEKHGHSPADVSRAMSISATGLSQELQARRVVKRLLALGLKAEHIKKTTLVKIHPILSQDDDIVKEAAKAIIRLKMTSDEVADFIRLLKKQRSRDDRLAFIDKQSAYHAPTVGANGKGSPTSNGSATAQRRISFMVSSEASRSDKLLRQIENHFGDKKNVYECGYTSATQIKAAEQGFRAVKELFTRLAKSAKASLGH